MITVRHIEKLWNSRKYPELMGELLGPRIEAAATAELAMNPSLAAAALGVIRLEELGQAGSPIVSVLIRAILSMQKLDGGWEEIALTALAVRALSVGQGRGEAIEAGVGFLATLRQPGGAWPKIPLRRMPEDALVSAFVMLELGDLELFRAHVDVGEVARWFERKRDIEPSALTMWQSAKVRVGGYTNATASWNTGSTWQSREMESLWS